MVSYSHIHIFETISTIAYLWLQHDIQIKGHQYYYTRISRLKTYAYGQPKQGG